MPDPMFEPAHVLKTIKAASRPVAFAFGDVAKDSVLGVDKTKNGAALFAAAKKLGATKGAFGEVVFESGQAVFTPEKPYPGLQKLIEQWMRANKLALRVIVRLPGIDEGDEEGDEDEDEESAQAKIFTGEEILKRLKLAKQGKDTFFAFGLGSEKTGNRLAMHPRFQGPKLALMIKKDNGATRGSSGEVTVDGMVATFLCEKPPLPGLKKFIRALFKEWKLAYRVVIMGPEGTEVVEADDEADDDVAAAPEPGETPRYSDPQLMQMIKDAGSSWSKVKNTYLSTPETMQQIVDFRKAYVDKLLRDLNAKCNNRLLAKSVGSSALTSDYDVTVSSKDGSGVEIDAIRAFNAKVKTDFGVPPGVCFDTNLYAKDFMTVKDTIMGTTEELDEGNIAQVEKLLTSDRSAQDVGALVKQRQYMPAEQWQDYVEAVIGEMEGEAADQARIQFEEAEDLYLTQSVQKVEGAIAVYNKALAAAGAVEKTPDQKKLDTMVAQWNAARSDHSAEGQRAIQMLIDELLEGFHKHGDEYSLEANNDLYLDKIAAVRVVQNKRKQVAALADIVKDAGDSADPAVVRELLQDSGVELTAPELASITADPAKAMPMLKKLLAEKADALAVQAKKQVADANYFASEAYLSEGPLAHIVAGKQSKDPKVLEMLQPIHLLESSNEQYGDFLKDIGHYKSNEGRAFTQTSKYLARMLEAVIMLRQKPGFETFEIKAMDYKRILKVKADIEEKLLPIRNADKPWDKAPDPERFAEGAKVAREIFGVDDLAGLTKLFNTINTQVNVAMRSAKKMELRANKEESEAYHRLREEQNDDRPEIVRMRSQLENAMPKLSAAMAADAGRRAGIETDLRGFETAASAGDIPAAKQALQALANALRVPASAS